MVTSKLGARPQRTAAGSHRRRTMEGARRRLRVFWLLDAARMLPFFGDHSWGPFSMLTAYERRRVYPVVLPMWTPIDRARMRLPELCWRDWGPFAHESYTAAFLGNGTQCAVLD